MHDEALTFRGKAAQKARRDAWITMREDDVTDRLHAARSSRGVKGKGPEGRNGGLADIIFPLQTSLESESYRIVERCDAATVVTVPVRSLLRHQEPATRLVSPDEDRTAHGG